MLRSQAAQTDSVTDFDSFDSALLYVKLAGDLANRIIHGQIEPGTKLPSVRHLSCERELSTATVLHAYRDLERRGLIEARPRSGYYVRERAPSRCFSRQSAENEEQFFIGGNRISKEQREKWTALVLSMMGESSVVHLGLGPPAPELLPIESLSRTLARMVREFPGMANRYAAGPGLRFLRRTVAERLGKISCILSPDEILITNGAMESFYIALRSVARPGDTIAVATPCYFGTLGAIENLGMIPLEIPSLENTGVDIDALESAVSKTKIAAFAVMPNYSNPTGSLMPEETRLRLLKFLTARSIPIIENDMNGDLCFGSKRPGVLKAMDTSGLVIYFSSVSKTLAPGFRIGWMNAGRFTEKAQMIKHTTSMPTASPTQLAIYEFLRSGAYDKHLESLRSLLVKNAEHVEALVLKHFPKGTRVTPPMGGSSLWVELPAGMNSIDLFQRAFKEQICLMPGAIFSSSDVFNHCLRFNCALSWGAELDAAVARVGEIAGVRN